MTMPWAICGGEVPAAVLPLAGATTSRRSG
jgi:hypothetical protein